MGSRALPTAALLLAFAATAHAQIDGTPDRAEMAPAPKGTKPVIPLNIDDPTYDLWKKRREDLAKGREPGPIDVQRYPGGMAHQGIPTFFRLPVALLPGDLSAGEVDVAIISAHNDMGLGVRGASRGPNDLRANGDVYGTWGAFSMPHMGTMINPFEELSVVDYGDAPTDPLSTERTMQGVREIVAEVAGVKHADGRRVIPFIVGGDHSLSYPNLAAILSLRALAVAALPSDRLDSALLPQALVQSVAVVRPVADQTIGGNLEKPVVDRLLHQGDLMG